MMQLLVRGGITMIPIIIVSVYAFAIVIEKFFAFGKFRSPDQYFLVTLYDLIRKRDWENALKICKKYNHPIASIIEAGLLEANKTVTDLRSIEEAMQIKGDEVIHKLETGIKFLASIITLLPLLGLVGTMVGLILAFQKWEIMGANVTISDLAGGIYHAMMATATGLTLLVPYYVIYNIFTIRVDTIELMLARYTTDFLSRIRNASAAAEKYESALPEKFLIEQPIEKKAVRK